MLFVATFAIYDLIISAFLVSKERSEATHTF